MKLWRIRQEEQHGYDTYDSAVVAAETEDEARRIDPSGYGQVFHEGHPHGWAFPGHAPSSRDDWANKMANIQVEYLGEAKPGTEAGVIVASFNAG